MSEYNKQLLNKGTIIGLVLFGLFVIYYLVLGQNPFSNIKWLSTIIQFILLYFFGKQIAVQFFGSKKTFKVLFTTFMYIVLVYTSLFGASTYLYSIFVDGKFTQMHIIEALEGLKQAKVLMPSQKALLSSLEAEIKAMTSGTLIWGEVLNKLLGGILISLIYSLILRDKNIELQEETPIAIS